MHAPIVGSDVHKIDVQIVFLLTVDARMDPLSLNISTREDCSLSGCRSFISLFVTADSEGAWSSRNRLMVLKKSTLHMLVIRSS